MNLTEISSTQRFDVVTANDNFEAVKIAALFGILREDTEALTLGLYGGMFWTGSAFSDLADTTVALTGSATNYVEANRTTGAVTVNQSAFTAGRIALYAITTNANGITGVTDYRSVHLQGGNAYIGTLTTDSLTIASGTLTDSAPALTITQTWNDAADTFVGADMNITNTNSAANSILQRWRVGGSVMASIDKDGDGIFAGDLAVNGGDLTSSATTFNLLNATVTTLNIGGAATSIAIGATAGNMAFGSAVDGFYRYKFSGNLASDGASTIAVGTIYSVNITAAAGDTSYHTQFLTAGTITTQGASEVIAVVAAFRLQEPNITVGAGDTVTLATTLHIASAPTEGTNNAALSIAIGALLSAGVAQFGAPLTFTPVGTIDAVAATGGVLTLRRNDTSVTAGDMIGKIQFYAADTSTTTNFIVANIEAQAVSTIATDINPGILLVRTTGSGVAATPTERSRWDHLGNFIHGTAAIATTATDGFFYIPSCAGTPTGVPTAYTGLVPLVVNSSANKLYFYSGGAWRDAGP